MSFVKSRLVVFGWAGLCGVSSACTPEGLGGGGTGGVTNTGGAAATRGTVTKGGTTAGERASGGVAAVTGWGAVRRVPGKRRQRGHRLRAHVRHGRISACLGHGVQSDRDIAV